jgi:hypothetical protein
MVPAALGFLITFATLTAAFAFAGRIFIAIWHPGGPIGGLPYWAHLVASPELLVFVFFMITDPQTSPHSSRGRALYGAATAAVAAALMFPHQTEYGIKVAILASLTVVCALVPWFEGRAARRHAPARDAGGADALFPLVAPRPSRARPVVIAVALVAVIVVVVGTLALATDNQLIVIEGGRPGTPGFQ